MLRFSVGFSAAVVFLLATGLPAVAVPAGVTPGPEVAPAAGGVPAAPPPEAALVERHERPTAAPPQLNTARNLTVRATPRNLTVANVTLEAVRVRRVTVDRLLVTDFETALGTQEEVAGTNFTLLNVTVTNLAVGNVTGSESLVAPLVGNRTQNGTTVIDHLHVHRVVVEGFSVEHQSLGAAELGTAGNETPADPAHRFGLVTTDRLFVRGATIQSLRSTGALGALAADGSVDNGTAANLRGDSITVGAVTLAAVTATPPPAENRTTARPTRSPARDPSRENL